MPLSGDDDTISTVLVGGHESAYGADLEPLLGDLPGTVTTSVGRGLHDAVSALLDRPDGRVVVLPMTWGRDPRTVADTARTLDWLAAGDQDGRVALCASFGTPDHLVSWLRRASNRTAAQHPGAAIVLAAPSADPFDDADLHRIAHLVRSDGAGVPVEVACLAGPTDLEEVVDRARMLGCAEVVVVPAGFAVSAPDGVPAEGVSFFGPLLSRQAVLDIARRRVAQAVHDLDHGHPGIAAGLLADRDHGYAHSHADVSGGAHPHAHPHEHRHAGGSPTPGPTSSPPGCC